MQRGSRWRAATGARGRVSQLQTIFLLAHVHRNASSRTIVRKMVCVNRSPMAFGMSFEMDDNARARRKGFFKRIRTRHRDERAGHCGKYRVQERRTNRRGDALGPEQLPAIAACVAGVFARQTLARRLRDAAGRAIRYQRRRAAR